MDKRKTSDFAFRLPKSDCRCGREFEMEIDLDDLRMRCPGCGRERRHRGFIARVLAAAEAEWRQDDR